MNSREIRSSEHIKVGSIYVDSYMCPGSRSTNMPESPSNLDALYLISDWAKWLVAIQTGAIALIGSLFTSENSPVDPLSKAFGTASIICFLVSIGAAGILLLTLPEIAQYLRPEQNIWNTRDSVAYRYSRLNTQGFALIESIFFGLGLSFTFAMLITVIWF